MEFLKLLFASMEVVEKNANTIILLTWLTICIIIFIVFALLANIITIIRRVIDDRKHKREIAFKETIYRSYVSIANKQLECGCDYSDIIETLNNGCICIFTDMNRTGANNPFTYLEGKGNNECIKPDEPNISTGGTEESVPK